MSITEIRKGIKKLVEKIEDKEMLETYLNLLKTEALRKKDFWNELDEPLKKAIEKSIVQADKGDLTPHEKVKKTYQKWL